MKKFIKIESNFKDNKEGCEYNISYDIHNIKTDELLHWLGNFLQNLVDNNAFSYDTLLKVVKYVVVDSKKDREEEYSKNMDNLIKERTADLFKHIEDVLNEGKNDN